MSNSLYAIFCLKGDLQQLKCVFSFHCNICIKHCKYNILKNINLFTEEDLLYLIGQVKC